MFRYFLPIIFCILTLPLLVSCILSESELNELLATSSNTNRVNLPFRRGDILTWDTGVGKGSMKVLSVDGGKFTVEQNNEKNRKAEDIVLTGEIFQDGTCRLHNPSWNEEWVGNLNDNTLVGKVNNIYDFRISWKVPDYMSHTVKSVSKLPFSKGDTLKWTEGTQCGKMKITSLEGDNFSADKYNDFDKKKVPAKMRSTVLKDGTYVLKSDSGKEVWTGKLSGNIISGKTKNGYNFKISRSNSVLDMPFKTGDALTLNTDYRRGNIKVFSVSSVGKFVLDIYPSYSMRVKDSTLDGEIMSDGTYKLINRETKEIWMGRRDGTKIAGKINNKSKFVIGGLK